MSGGLSPKAEAVLIGHKEAHEVMGELEKAAEVENDMATLRRIASERGIHMRHQSEPAPISEPEPKAIPKWRRAGRCQQCGNKFQFGSRGRVKAFCTERCRTAAREARWEAARVAADGQTSGDCGNG